MTPRVPVTVLDPDHMMAATHKQYMILRERMSMEFSIEWLEATLKDFLRKGLIETLKVIEAADQGDDIARRALVCVHSDMRDPPARLKAYVERTALRGPPTRKPGQHGHLMTTGGAISASPSWCTGSTPILA